MKRKPIHRNAIGLDAHREQVTACLIAEQEDGSIHTETVTFGTFRRDRRALAKWARDANPGIVAIGEHRHLLEKRQQGFGAR